MRWILVFGILLLLVAPTMSTWAQGTDVNPPSITVLAPKDGQRSFASLAALADVQDESALSSVTFKLDTKDPEFTMSISPSYFYALVVLQGVAPGRHNLTVTATDAHGNTATETTVVCVRTCR